MKIPRLASATLAGIILTTSTCLGQVLNYNEFSTAEPGVLVNGSRLTNVTAMEATHATTADAAAVATSSGLATTAASPTSSGLAPRMLVALDSGNAFTLVSPFNLNQVTNWNRLTTNALDGAANEGANIATNAGSLAAWSLVAPSAYDNAVVFTVKSNVLDAAARGYVAAQTNIDNSRYANKAEFVAGTNISSGKIDRPEFVTFTNGVLNAATNAGQLEQWTHQGTNSFPAKNDYTAFTNNVLSGGYIEMISSNVFIPAKSFFSRNGITDPAIQNNIINWIVDLQASGQYSNLIDAAFFTPAYNPSASKTFFGQTITTVNPSYGSRGLHFNRNTTAWFPVTVPCSNNWVVAWNNTFTNPPVALYGMPFELVDTNSLSSESYWQAGGVDNGLSHFNVQSNTLSYPKSESFSNLVYTYRCSAFSYLAMQSEERRVSVFSHDGRGVQRMFDQGNSCLINLFDQNAAFQAADYPRTDLNACYLGTPFSTNGFAGPVGAWAGDIEAIMIFRGPATTNSAKVNGYALDWITTNTTRTFWVGDSRMDGNGKTNNMQWTFSHSQKYGGQIDIVQYAGGTTLQGYSSDLNLSNIIYGCGSPHGNVTTTAIRTAASINDIFGGRSAAQMFADLTNFLAPTFGNKSFKTYVFDEMQTSTNSAVYKQTAGTEAVRQLFNWMLYTNRYLFTEVCKRDALVTQDMLNTNRAVRLSTDGIHFNDPTNGNSVYTFIALANMDDQPVYSGGQFYGTFQGTFTGDGTGIINIPATSINYRSGITNIANLATTQVITFSSPFSTTVNTNYAITFGFDGTLAAAAALSATAKSSNGFTVNIIGITAGATIYYMAFPYQ